MKAILLTLSLTAAVILFSCSNNNSKESGDASKDSIPQDTGNNTGISKAGSINEVVSGYLSLKNALTDDNEKDAAAAASQVNAALANLDESAFTAEQKKVYDEVKDDIKEHAEHIASKSSDIAHQREHFDLLSQDVIDLVGAMGSSQTLYKDFCPMYNNKKGAYWLSETKEIKNPYYGKEMLTCGEVRGEIKPKG